MNDVTLAEVSTVRLKLSFFVKYTAGIGDTVDFGCVVNVLFVCVSSLIILTVIEDVRSFEVKFDACARDIYSICRPPKPRSTWHSYSTSIRGFVKKNGNLPRFTANPARTNKLLLLL